MSLTFRDATLIAAISPMRAMKSWLSLLATVVALLVANPGFASVVSASDHSLGAAAAPTHCAHVPGDAAPAPGKHPAPCEHCLLCGVAFIAPFEAPRAAEPIAVLLRPVPLTVERALRPREQASANRARAPPLA